MAHGYRTDHSIIYLTIYTKVCQRGKGFWKLNVSLLYDSVYVKLVKEEIHNVKILYYTKNNEVDPQTYFKMLKLNIRGKTISYSSYKSKCEKRKQQNIENKINALLVCKQQNKATCVLARIETDLSKLKKELEILRQPQIRVMMLRARVQYYEEGGKPYFCNLKKDSFSKKLVSRLNINGNIIQNQGDIINEMRAYYKKLYSSKLSNVAELKKFFEGEQY